MSWSVYVVYFFVGAFFVNAIPHTVEGMSGNKFQTPFAKPRGVGESSAIVNVIWGLSNFVIAVVLLHVFPAPSPLPCSLWIAIMAGAFALAIYLANHFGKVRREGPKP